MMKRKAIILVLITFLVAALPTIAFAAEGNLYSDGTFNYIELSNRTLSVIEYIGSGGTVVIPSSFGPGNVPVTAIEANAFSGNNTISSIKIPSSITTIGHGAFAQSDSLNNVTLNDGLTLIEDAMFEDCGTLKTITIPSSITTVGDKAFNNCSSLQKVIIYSKTVTFGSNAFVNTNLSTDGIYSFSGSMAENYANTNGIPFNLLHGIVTVTANNPLYGIVTGDGRYEIGHTVTVTAAPNAGYRFLRWTEGGSEVSTNAEYSFIVSQNTTLIAEFAINNFTVNVTANNAAYGTVTGGGEYDEGETVSVKATPNAGYQFVRWMEDSQQVSTNAEYTFTVSKSRTLIAEFASIDVPSLTVSSAGYDSIKVSWTAVYGAAGYEVYRTTSSNGTYSKIYTATSGSTVNYINTGLATGTTYYYKVRAYCKAGTTTTYGDYSSIKNVQPIPSTPLVAAASASYNSITLSWGQIAGASGYEVYRAASSGGSYSLIKAITTISYSDTGLTTGKTYYYKVRAYRTEGTTKVYSAYSEYKSAIPVPATPLISVASASYNSVKVSWNTVAGASGYEVYRATSSAGAYSRVYTTTSGGTVSYTDKSLTTGKTYYYQVRAYRKVGSALTYSAYSAVKSVSPVPATPTNVKAASSSPTSIIVSWGNVSGATGYEVYQATSSTGTYSLLQTTTSMSYINTGLTMGKTYYYKIRAYRTMDGTKVYGYFSVSVAKAPALSKYSTAPLPWVCLTVDDGYGYDNIKRVLDTLRNNKVNCTFFVIGDQLLDAKLQPLWRQAIQDGNEICYHTMSHTSVRSMSDSQINSDLSTWENAAHQVLGADYVIPKFVRLPGGNGSDDQRILKLFHNCGYKVIYWSMDTLTGAIKKHRSIDAYIKNNTKQGSIILTHFNYNDSTAMAQYLPWLKDRFKLGTLSEAFAP